MEWSSIKTLLVFITALVITDCAKLNDYILDYQPLSYDRTAVHRNHERVRRSTDLELKIRFNAYGRNFQLELSPAEGIFHPDHQVFIQDKGLQYVDTSFIYQGKVRGEPRSSVLVSVHNGTVEGHVELPETRYHIESATKYLQDPVFHSIIYPETHLDKDPYRARRAAERSTCAVDHLREWMETASRPLESASRVQKRSADTDRERLPHNIYTASSNTAGGAPSSSSRVRRELGANNTCPIHMKADPLLFDFFKKQKHGTLISDTQAEEEILAFFANHVSAITSIYSGTQFQTYDSGLKNRGLGFNIRRTTVMKQCGGSVSNDYCANTVDVSNYLDLTSREDHDLFCLTFSFTYRDFSGGTLGLAWVATESNTNSGVCGRHTMFTGGVKKSLNTGIVTIINFGKTVPNRVSQLTFAHEVGHNFGSPHDIGSDECAPFGTSRSDASGGNYIMFPSATSGDKTHNDDFSPCSRDNMTRIINQIVTGIRNQCFTVSGAAFCGNKITEGTEQCDCGFADECNSTHSCCNPKQQSFNNPDACKLKVGNQCSPDSGVCCHPNCTLILSSAAKECAPETECSERAVCNGANFTCPQPVHKANKSFCNDYTKTCLNGECIAPICARIAGGGWEECFQVSAAQGVSDTDLCYVACKNPTSNVCISSSNTDALAKPENAPFKAVLEEAAQGKNKPTVLAITLPAGSACDNFRGYCDAFSKCERIDAQGPFNQLTNMIFDPVTLGKVKEWIVEHWWAVLLMAVGLVVFMGVFIKVFGYNTPSEDPKRKRQREERERARQQQNNRPNSKQGRPLPQQPSAPYHTGMDIDMSNYPRGVNGPQNQYDRINPGYSGHSYDSPGYGGKNQH